MVSYADAIAPLRALASEPPARPAPIAAPVSPYIDDETFNAVWEDVLSPAQQGIGHNRKESLHIDSPLTPPHNQPYSPAVQWVVGMYFPMLWGRYKALRADHPTWTPAMLEEAWWELSIAATKGLGGWASQAAAVWSGGEATERFIDTLYREATEHQPRKAPEQRAHTGEEHGQLLRRWERANDLITAANQWLTLTEGMREAYLREFAANIQWKTFDTRTKIAIGNLAKDQGRGFEQTKRQLLMTGGMLAMGQWREAQTHRFDKKWPKGSDGKRARLVPGNFQWLDAWEWFVDESCKAAIAVLWDQPYPAPDEKQIEQDSKTIWLADSVGTHETLYGMPDADPLLALLVREDDNENSRRIADLLAALESLSPSDQDLLLACGGGLSGPDLAIRFGTTQPNIRKRLERAKARLRDRMTG